MYGLLGLLPQSGEFDVNSTFRNTLFYPLYIDCSDSLYEENYRVKCLT